MKTMMMGTALAALLLLTGCSGTESEPKPKAEADSIFSDDFYEADESDTQVAEEYGITVEQTESLFASLMRTEYPGDFGVLEDEQIVALGRGTCSMFDAGVTWEEGALTGMNAGYDADVVGFLYGAAITAFCPEHSGLVPGV